ncbi:MAG: O-antigen ligase family protein [Microthrixaceae bacterium]|nr:O-antigen ligase family protein [Microthrixaceae bacterium]
MAWIALAALLVVAAAFLVSTRIGVLVGLGVAFVAGCVFYALRREVAFLQLVAFLIHFDGIGLGPLTLGRAVSVATIGLIGYKLLAEKWRPPAVPVRHWIGPMALLIWGVMSAGWAVETGSWFLGLGALGLAVAFFLASGFLVDSYDKVLLFLRAYWYGGIFGAFAGTWGLLIGLRSFGFNGDPNLFGVLAASMIPLTFFYRRNATTQREKLIYTAVLLLVIVGAAGAGSRSGVIGAAVALFGSLVYRPGASVKQSVAWVVPAALLTGVVAVGLLIINPNTVERGTDSSGRLDFWKVAVDLIEERPVVGHGLQQIEAMIPPRLAITPGAEKLSDKRDAVGSHNTWLDIAGNLGFVGATIFAFTLAVTLLGLLRPKWAQTKEVSGYLFVMFLPVITGSMFLGLLNNKLAWSIIGLAGILQVPSWGVRYRGYFSRPAERAPQLAFSAPKLARWDLRISQRFRVWVVFGALIGALVATAIGSGVRTTYTSSVSLMVPKLDVPAGVEKIFIDDERVSMIHTLVLSDAYGARLAELSGVALTPSQAAERVKVNRPDFGPYLEVSFTDTSEEVVAAVSPYLLPALDDLIEDGREFTIPTLTDELRPTVPGEQRWYTGPLYLPVSDVAHTRSQPPRSTWLLLTGAASGALVAAGSMLLMQRRPRVNNDDDFDEALGLELWSHVGRRGRRNAATADQFSQVAVRGLEEVRGSGWPGRIVVAAPHHGASARALAVGIASAIAASGQKVVLVDGQPTRPWLSVRFGMWHRRGLSDLTAARSSLDEVLRRIPAPLLPRRVRRALGTRRENLRFLPAGRFVHGSGAGVDPAALDRIDESVTCVLLAPPMLGEVPVAPVLAWADVVFYDLVEGSTVTFDAEDGALQIATFATAPAGVVLSDV